MRALNYLLNSNESLRNEQPIRQEFLLHIHEKGLDENSEIYTDYETDITGLEPNETTSSSKENAELLVPARALERFNG